MNDVYSSNRPTTTAQAALITPRAEFRVFGQGVIDTVRAHMYNGRTVLQQARRMPAETYLLSVHTDEANVKVRDGLLDIKTRVGQTPEGYEIFQPRGKFPFPVPGAELAAILSHLLVQMPASDMERMPMEAFVGAARAHPQLRVVSVEKMRYGFTIDGVICEYAQVWFNGALIETACAESEDYGRMSEVIEGLGLEGLPNTNYLRAAKRVVGLI